MKITGDKLYMNKLVRCHFSYNRINVYTICIISSDNICMNPYLTLIFRKNSLDSLIMLDINSALFFIIIVLWFYLKLN